MGGPAEQSEAVREFERQRARLMGLAYRLLGSAADAEDVVQDVFLRWHGTEPGAVARPAAWLVKVTTNLCLNRLESAPRRRERYVGQWLPEPVLTAGDALGPMETAEQRDTVSLAFLVLAEQLAPGERAVFVLREAFGYSHREVAELIELSEANSRQLHSRARKRLADARFPRSRGEAAGNRLLIERFLDAARGGDLAALERLLADDVTSIADGEGTAGVARLPVRGAAKVARYFATVTLRYIDRLTVSFGEVNGEQAILARSGDMLVGVLVPEIADGRITGFRVLANPGKLRFAEAQLSRSAELSGS